jgi:tetratricopeptide (TPR) repeat protein
VRREDTVRLNTHFLVRRIEVLGLKQGWVADQVGVARKTVSRWATGKVKRIERASAEALADVLSCALADLLASDPVLATKEEQKVAAKLIQEHDLLELLSPTDNWQLAESLIKASMQPDLPLADVGRLHNLLSIACWRQGKYESGKEHAQRAFEIGDRSGEPSVVLGALYNTAVVDSLCGDLGSALLTYERCLERPESFETSRDHAKVLSNLGDAYRSFLRYDESVATQLKSIELFEELGLDLNLAISEVSLGGCLCAAGRFAEAGAAYARGAEHAQRAGYARGIDCAPFYRSDVLTLSGDTSEAKALIDAALPALEKHPVYDLGCHEIAARVYRRAQAWDAAEAQLKEGLRRSESFHELHGMLLLEAVRLAQVRERGAESARLREDAGAAFGRAGLDLRAPTGPVPEHGD